MKNDKNILPIISFIDMRAPKKQSTMGFINLKRVHFLNCYRHRSLSSEANATLFPIWKRGFSKQGILKSLISHVLNCKSWIKLIYDTLDVYNFVINEFNPIFAVQNMGNEAFQNASFGNTSFPKESLDYSCLRAKIV